jgi:hypothetical protein
VDASLRIPFSTATMGFVAGIFYLSPGSPMSALVIDPTDHSVGRQRHLALNHSHSPTTPVTQQAYYYTPTFHPSGTTPHRRKL